MQALEKIIAADGKSVRVRTEKTPRGKWSLAVVDRFGNTTEWPELFKTSELAFTKAVTMIQERGILFFVRPPEPMKEARLQ